VGAIVSGNIDIDAVAGLDSSICQVPPLMVCCGSGSQGSVEKQWTRSDGERYCEYKSSHRF
jgi:hypothetical protein